jgi:single-stranded-DNA-specific exonuclease
VLVIDHHEADRVSEHACIINNQLCDYPTKSLSGVGMVYKFCSYIDRLLNVDYAD